MIENITIRCVASYSAQGQNLIGLSNNNFFYGSNGTGKTTISKVIADETGFPDCTVTWRGGNKIDTFVYNKDFVKANFNESSELKGIFTLGETTPETIQKIQEANSDIEKLNESIRQLRESLQGKDNNGGKLKEKDDLEALFEKKCWVYKTKHDGDFKGAFKGVGDKKQKFKERLIYESEQNTSTTQNLEGLKNKSKTVFAGSLEKIGFLPTPNFQDLLDLESSSVLVKKVVGKDDIDIASLIKKVNNSDWVKEGMTYLDHSGRQCPFCQQSIEQGLKEELSQYFDETYLNDMSAILTLQTNYNSYSESFMQTLDSILKSDCDKLDTDKLRILYDLLVTKVSANIQHIQRKNKEASAIVTLESMSDVLNNINALLVDSNKKIASHNTLIDNIVSESKTLTSEIWRYICDEIKEDYEEYKTKVESLEKAIKGLNKGIEEKKLQAKEKDEERQELEKNITSIQPTIDHINKLLKSFGFIGFELSESEQNGFYKIVRSDGTEVEDTLSEGEKTFITFLYFYHLLNGSNAKDSITKPRVVVFDDPVSSLDSDILFIVSNLIKGVFEEIKNGDGSIKQAFVLTHNVFFHKEVSFNSNRRNGVMNDETFWVVKKNNNETCIEKKNENPIMTSYELLWNELKSDSISNLTIQNTLRRILENYFKILGNIDKDEIINMFDGQKKVICASLFAWINDGSHFANDDLYICTDDATVQQYLNVFKDIFEKSKHIEHYKMMMGKYELPEVC